MKRNTYSAAAVSSLLWFMEFKKEIMLLNDGKSFDEIKSMSEKENIFGAATPARAKNIYSKTTSRIKSLDESIYGVFCNADISNQKLITLIATMAQDTLFFDFMYEVFREKLIIGSNEISKTDIRVFFKNKASQDDNVAKWTDETLKRLERTYIGYMSDAGIIDNKKRAEKRKITRPILDYDLKNWLELYGYEVIVKILEGVR
ncbi:Putative inner membrane protein [Eubacterium uniforme]|uniref:Putative inner membrane protein n=1 Tax=Eubacterium uniforme TaxID=39495 RepID=A0A1T4VZ45_9FIRM|nr:DUF1819 family protein [Eubacterium uniforme]SKA70294.1 Putative inner membrane protein [Eubacterium uniforme]